MQKPEIVVLNKCDSLSEEEIKNKIPMKAIIRPLIKSMICVVVFNVPRMMLITVIDDVLINTILFYVATYLTDLAIAFIFVDDQIKLQKKIDEKNDQLGALKAQDHLNFRDLATCFCSSSERNVSFLHN